MIDQVSRALCDAAGRSIYANPDHAAAMCSCCENLPDGTRRCIYWETFRGEARAAIAAAYVWHKENRRWPSWLK